MPSSGKPDFFISYNKADHGWAEWIAWELEEAQYATVLQAWDFRPGQNFVLQMQRSTAEAERTLMVVSPDYLSALFTQPEWAAAFAADPMGWDGKVIPVVVRECVPQGLLSQLIRIDLVGLSETEAREALQAGIQKGRVKPPVRPSFPGQAREGRKELAFPGAPLCLGRKSELKKIVASICRKLPLPVPVLGPPGVGRTTVVLAALHDQRVTQRFGERRWFVRCQGAASRYELSAKIAQSLGLTTGPSPEPTLLAELQLGPALLVLDDAEVPWEEDPVEVEELLSCLAAVKTLALVVSVRGEQRPVGPCWREAVHLGPLELSTAREAFLAVAGETFRQDLDLDRLLEAVDRLPLAVAMLAHQAQGQPNLVDLWLGWQSQRTAMLRRGKSASLRPLEVSLSLAIGSPRMTAAAKLLLSLLGLLPDGLAWCDFAALPPGEATDAAATLRHVGLAFDQGTRLRLLSPIREHVRRELPPSQEDLDSAIDHFLELALLGERSGHEAGGDGSRRLLHDAGNLEAMVLAALKRPDVARAARAALALTDLLLLAGQDASHLLQESCRACRESGLVRETAACLRRLGDVALEQGEPEAAHERYEEARTQYRRLGDVLGEAHCRKALGDVALAWAEPAPETARAHFREALSLYRCTEDLLARARCLEDLGDLALRQSSYSMARFRYLEALLLYKRAQEPMFQAACLKILGDIALVEHLSHVADSHYREALSLFRLMGHSLCEALCMRNLGDLALERRYFSAARTWYEQALAVYESLDHLSGRAGCLRRLGDVAAASDPETARALYGEGLELYRHIPPTSGAAWCARRLGDLALAELDSSAARELYEEALHLYRCASNLLGEMYCATKLAEIALAQVGDLPSEPVRLNSLRVMKALDLQEGFAAKTSFPNLDQPLFDQFPSYRLGYRWIQYSPPSLLADAQARQDLGKAALARGDFKSARSFYEEAAVLFQRLGFPLGAAECLKRLGDISLATDRAGTARLRYEDALQLYRSAGGRLGESSCLRMLRRTAPNEASV